MVDASGSAEARQREADRRLQAAMARAFDAENKCRPIAAAHHPLFAPFSERPAEPRKPPGRWTEYEDDIVKSGVKSKRPHNEVAKSLNRLERSVLIRAKVLGMPFQV